LPFPGGGVGYATVVENRSSTPYVIRVSDDLETRYYIASEGALTVVDGVGEGNPPATTIAVLDSTCSMIEMLDRDFSQGGTLTIGEGGVMLFSPGRQGAGADERVGAMSSCPTGVE
jgi:hypothetical protein